MGTTSMIMDKHQMKKINVCDNAEDSHLDTVSLQSSRGLRKTVLNNVDRFLNSGNKQIKL